MKAITTLWGTVLACIAFTGQVAAQEAEDFYPTGTYWEEAFYDYASPESESRGQVFDSFRNK